MVTNVSFRLAANHWLIRARWFYILGIAALFVAFRLPKLSAINFDWLRSAIEQPLFFVLLMAVLSNALLFFISRMIDLETAHKHIGWLSFLSIAVEITLITLLLADLPGAEGIVSILYFIPIVESIVLFGHFGPLAVAILIGLIMSTVTVMRNTGAFEWLIRGTDRPNDSSVFTWTLILSVVYLIIGSVSSYISRSIGEREKRLARVAEERQVQVNALKNFNRELEKEERAIKAKDYELEMANDRLEQLEEAKSKFVAVTAHQLRTPLSAIKWTFDMMQSGQLGPVNEEQKEFLKKGFASTQRMIRIVNDLLNVDQLEADRKDYQFAPVDLVSLLDGVSAEFTNQALSKKISFELKKPTKALPPIEGDENKLRVVLENLIDNAIKYTPQGGRVSVTLSDDKLNSANRAIQVDIADSGIGIADTDRSKVFSKFFRASNAIRIEPDGSGIGLYLSKDIVEMHGGSLSYEQAPGGGTVFHLILPLTQKS